METTNITQSTYFHALRAPQMTIKSYLKRIEEKRCCSDNVFVLALIYIDRLVRSNRNFMVNSLSIHRVIITSIMIASKSFDEPVISNAYFARVGHISCKEINMLEIDFLFRIHFDLSVKANLFHTYKDRLLRHVQPPEGGDDAKNSGNEHKSYGQQEDQLAQDKAAPKPPMVAHYILPVESKEMDNMSETANCSKNSEMKQTQLVALA